MFHQWLIKLIISPRQHRGRRAPCTALILSAAPPLSMRSLLYMLLLICPSATFLRTLKSQVQGWPPRAFLHLNAFDINLLFCTTVSLSKIETDPPSRPAWMTKEKDIRGDRNWSDRMTQATFTPRRSTMENMGRYEGHLCVQYKTDQNRGRHLLKGVDFGVEKNWLFLCLPK